MLDEQLEMVRGEASGGATEGGSTEGRLKEERFGRFCRDRHVGEEVKEDTTEGKAHDWRRGKVARREGRMTTAGEEVIEEDRKENEKDSEEGRSP